MNPPGDTDWANAYAQQAQRLISLARSARVTLAGYCACVDTILSLHDAAPLLLTATEEAPARLGRELLRRAQAGIGGEISVDWPGGPAWLDHLTSTRSAGGTAAQAAEMLATLGAPVLLALQDRSLVQTTLLHPNILVADSGRATRLGSLSPGGALAKPPHYIFEYTAGVEVAGIVPPRSTRVIVRFADDGMECDPEFDELSLRLAPDAGAGVLAGFNAVPADYLDKALSHVVHVAGGWRRAGLRLLHVELADFPDPHARSAMLTAFRGIATSIGMNHNELHAAIPGSRSIAAKAQRLGDELGLCRVSVHADDWALSVTRDDPTIENEALITGCLLAAHRAATGRPGVPIGPPPGALYRTSSIPSTVAAGENWSVVACPAPFLPRPASTLGLGDTFVAGSMLVLGQQMRSSTGGRQRDNQRITIKSGRQDEYAKRDA